MNGSDWKAREGQALLFTSTAGERTTGRFARSNRRQMPPTVVVTLGTLVVLPSSSVDKHQPQ